MLAIEKVAKALTKKELKAKGGNEIVVKNLISKQVGDGLKLSAHFEERVVQRFSADESELLAGAISRAIRQTKPLELGTHHLPKSQKFIDESGIVIVLERIGRFGAVLVTSYMLGKENLLSDIELRELKLRGIL
ncbi:hypothetical protein CQA49_00815 [Helicobacter sp. MIT 00-7814]|nr:hypothetical protein CQA37_04405 [Helicobacter sp. MIT 99-10781]RDU56974.1 hypothetical protein CQA49_00815 [Helicobacter sp. MIT 00-7814]